MLTLSKGKYLFVPHSPSSQPHQDLRAIPSIETLQQELAGILLTAGAQAGVRVILTELDREPRLEFMLPDTQQARDMLSGFAQKGVYCADPDSGRRLSQLAAVQRVLFYRSILVRGRIIHGPLSGIVVCFGAQDTATDVAFPDARFGVHPANAQLAGQMVAVRNGLLEHIAHSAPPQRLDVVYTWVDGSDSNWFEKRRKYNPDMPAADAEHHARFDNNDELMYSLRALFRYFNGLGRVYLVTDAQIPIFMGEFADKVTIIDHADIMPQSVVRPTFNSHVIESCLHRISGLSEHYLYLNDDFLFARPSGPMDFFDPEGRGKCFFSNRSFIPKGEITDKTLAVDVAAINLRNLLAAKYNHTITRKFQHAPVSLKKSVLYDMETTFHQAFADLRRNRFRAHNDLSPSGSFYLHYALMTGQVIPSTIRYRYYETSAKTLFLKLLKLSVETDIQRPTVHCINATGDRSMSGLNTWALRSQMGALYPPERSPYPINTGLDKLRHKTLNGLLSVWRTYRKMFKNNA